MKFLPATRRGVVGATLAGLVGARAGWAATDVPERATLLAPGPEGGTAERFAVAAARGLARGLVQAAALRVNLVGGPDGVTAANRFAANAVGDSRTLLVLPGQAGQALLVGDGRARYEPRQWPAVSASLQPALLAGRGALAEGTPVRLAIGGPTSPDSAALLALDLLGRPATPVMLSAGMSPEAAVTSGIADAAVVVGRSAGVRAAVLGLTPWFAFDGPRGQREPTMPDVPSLAEILADPAQPMLLAACRAAATAMRVRGVLVLPTLASADMVALWRAAAKRWGDVNPESGEPGERLVQAEEAADALGTLCPPSEVALAYRHWLTRRLGWQPA